MNEAPLDPEVTALLASLGPHVPATDVTAEEMREGMKAAIAEFTRGAAPIDVHHVKDDLAPGRHGDIPVRVYSPETPTAAIVYLHGGAWVAGDIDTHDLVTRRIARDTGAVVISVDYRMLPEHPFPAPIDDTYDALVWAAETYPDLPLLVAGDSAGGTLSASIALRIRDEGGPRLTGQVLIYPATDDDLDTPSMFAFDGPVITRDDLRHHFGRYSGTDVSKDSPYAMPARATSLADLPPAIMAIPGHDSLRSGEEAYVRRLQDAGVDVVVQLDPDLAHAWVDYAPRVPSADRAFTRLTDNINQLIHRGTTPA